MITNLINNYVKIYLMTKLSKFIIFQDLKTDRSKINIHGGNCDFLQISFITSYTGIFSLLKSENSYQLEKHDSFSSLICAWAWVLNKFKYPSDTNTTIPHDARCI